jgi:hypothetical protein
MSELLPKEKLHPESCPRHGMWVVGLGCPYCIRDERDQAITAARWNAGQVAVMQTDRDDLLRQRDALHDQLAHLQNAPRSFR